MDFRRTAAVAAGGVVGAGLRWFVLWLLGPSGATTGVLMVNVVGSAVLGTVAGLPPRHRHEPRDAFVAAGVCGALTTWSTLALQVATDLRGGDWATGLSWLTANLVLGVAAATAAHHLTAARDAEAR